MLGIRQKETGHPPQSWKLYTEGTKLIPLPSCQALYTWKVLPHGLFLKITVRLIPPASPMPLRWTSAWGMHFWASVLFPFDHIYYLLTSSYARYIFCRLFQNCSRIPINKQININEMNERMKFKHLANCMTAVVMTNNSPPITYPCSQRQPQWHSPPLKLLGGS